MHSFTEARIITGRGPDLVSMRTRHRNPLYGDTPTSNDPFLWMNFKTACGQGKQYVQENFPELRNSAIHVTNTEVKK